MQERGLSGCCQLAALTLVARGVQELRIPQRPDHLSMGKAARHRGDSSPRSCVAPTRQLWWHARRPSSAGSRGTAAAMVPSVVDALGDANQRGRPRCRGALDVAVPSMSRCPRCRDALDVAMPSMSRCPRCRDALVDADYLEVSDGPGQPSALSFRTRICTAASPKTCVSSAFHQPIDCSDASSLRES